MLILPYIDKIMTLENIYFNYITNLHFTHSMHDIYMKKQTAIDIIQIVLSLFNTHQVN